MIYPFNKLGIRSAQLRDELGSSCESVRWSTNGSGEIVHDGQLTDVQIQAVIDAHVPLETNDEKIIKPTITQLINDLENGVGTAQERIQRCELTLVKILKYLRKESI